jgi:hypothetical protein
VCTDGTLSVTRRLYRRERRNTVELEGEVPERPHQCHSIKECGEECLDGRRLWGLERGHHVAAKAWPNRPERGEDVAEKPDGVAVIRVERQPGDRPVGQHDPRADQRSLAIAGRRGDQRQLARKPSV